MSTNNSTQNLPNVKYTAQIFAMDSITGTFAGYTNGDTWNGWACPSFTFEVAEQVLNASAVNGYQWRYEPEDDTFIVWNVNDPLDYGNEYFEGFTVQIDGQTIKVYPIGAQTWIWETVETDPKPSTTDHQLAILFAGLDAVHPAVAAALRASFAQQVATLDADSADYDALVADLINVLRGQFVAEMHADHRYTGMPLSVTEAK